MYYEEIWDRVNAKITRDMYDEDIEISEGIQRDAEAGYEGICEDFPSCGHETPEGCRRYHRRN